MPNITQAQAIANLTTRFNQFLENAKKVNELPAQLVLNSDSKLHVMINGQSQYLTVQQILNAFISQTYKELVSVGSIVKVGTEVQFTDIVWKIAGVQSTKTVNIEVPLTDTGYVRGDIFVGNNLGEIERIEGIPSNTVALFEAVPYDAVYITQVLVTDSSVADPSDPNFGTDFLEKAYSSTQTHFGDTEINTLGLSEKRGGVIITGSVPKLGGFQRNSNNYVLGAPFFVHNRTTGVLELVNRNGSSNLQMIFPDEENLFLRKDHVAFFVEVVIDGVNYKKFVASSSYMPKASQTQSGGVKTTANEADPLVYTYQEVDALIEYSETNLQTQIDKKLTIYNNINADTTAPLNSHLNVIGNCEITSPAPIDGKGYYEVNVVNGIAIIDGVDYGVGSLVLKTWYDGEWKTDVYLNGVQVQELISEIPTPILFTTDASLYLDPTTNELRANTGLSTENFEYTSGLQEFTLVDEPTFVISLMLNLVAINNPLTDYSIDGKKLTILKPLEATDKINITYQFIITT